MKFKIENTEVFGLNKSIIASGNAMRTNIENNTAFTKVVAFYNLGKIKIENSIRSCGQRLA